LRKILIKVIAMDLTVNTVRRIGVRPNSFTTKQITKEENIMFDDSNEDVADLTLAMERRNSTDRELVSLDELIKYLRR